MNRRQLLSMLASLSGSLGAASLLAACGLGAALPSKIPHVGYVDIGPQPVANLADHPFSKGLRDLGYLEGKTVVVDYRFANNDEQRLKGLVTELVTASVNVLVTAGSGGQALFVAKQATTTIPIVAASGGGDPVKEGWAVSLAHPGGNITGNYSQPLSMFTKRMEVLKQTVPGLRTVAVLWDSSVALQQGQFADTQQAARSLGIEVLSVEVRGPDDFDGAFRAAVAGQARGLVILGGAASSYRSQLASLANANHLASITAQRAWPAGGGLLAYGPNSDQQLRYAASYVDKIIKGAKPSDLPIEEPANFDFVINLQTAQALGLTISPAILAQATEVIQ